MVLEKVGKVVRKEDTEMAYVDDYRNVRRGLKDKILVDAETEDVYEAIVVDDKVYRVLVDKEDGIAEAIPIPEVVAEKLKFLVRMRNEFIDKYVVPMYSQDNS